MIKKLTLFITFTFIFFQVFAQRITVGPGNITNTNIAGPFATINTQHYSSYAYIYPEVSIPGILHNDTVEAIDFNRNGPNGSVPGVSNVKIWMINTSLNDFGAANINFAAERLNLNAKLVFDGSPGNIIDSFVGFKKFTLNNKFRFDTTLGKNLMMFIEYEQDSFPTNQIFWNADNAFGVNGYVNNQVKFARDSFVMPTNSNSNTSWHPQIRFDIPRADYEGGILIPYTYGKIPVPLGNPDTIKLRVVNFGKKDASNVKIFVRSRGANVFVDSVIADMPRFEETIVTFPTRSITNEGNDTLTFELPADSSLLNNTREHIRQATRDVYSYRIVSEPLAPGGIGFNGGTGNFVCKFASNDKKLINQIEVNFGQVGRPFRIGIWEFNTSNGRPGALLWESDSLTSSNLSTIPVFPPVEVDGNFYTGVRQLGTQNVAFGYQLEAPVRPQTFWYSAPLADTNWIDFAPNAPFRFAIEPRVQANYDVMTLSIDSPKMNDTFNYYDFDTIRPTATFYNLGAQDMDTLINFRCEMYIGNVKVLDLTMQDSIQSGKIKIVQFDTAFVPQFAGDYRMLVYPVWARDSLPLNDSAEINFVVAFFDDIGPEFAFTPFDNQVYEYKRDTVKPLFRIRNYAYNEARNFWTRVRILNTKDELVYHDSTFVASLPSGANAILGTGNWPAELIDTFTIQFITDLPQERDRSFDTLQRSFIIRKTRDAASLNIVDPALNKAYSNFNSLPRPKAWVRNFGLVTETDFKTYIEVTDEADNYLYSDTVISIVQFGDSALVQFIDTLKLKTRGVYKVKMVSRVVNDYETVNDTIAGIFYYGLERDAKADSILNPNKNIVYELNQGTFPAKGKVTNLGFDSMRNTAVKLEGVDDEGTLFYISSQFVTLDSSESAELDFTNVVFSKPGNVELRLITLLDNDQNAGNDTFRQFYFVQISNDVGVDSITLPFDQERIRANRPFNPQALLTNYGVLDQGTPFNVNCLIQDKNGITVYNSTNMVTIDSGETLTHTFSDQVTLTDTGIYQIRIRSELSTDQYLQNDFVLQDFEVYYGSNSSIIDTFPKSNVRYVPHAPSLNRPAVVNLSKFGEDNIPDTGKVYILINSINTSYIYSDSVSYALNGNKDTSIQFNIPFDGNIRDTFRASAWLKAKEDDLPGDDSINFGFSVMFGTSIIDLENGINIGPNPSAGIFSLDLQKNYIGKEVKVYDVSGKKVLEKRISATQETINLSNLADGTYVLHLNGLTYILIKKR